MKNIFKKMTITGSLGLTLMLPTPVKADMFGGDVAVLVQILSNAIQQLQQLQQIVGTARDNINLVQEINRGINDSLHMAQTMATKIDPGLYKDWNNLQSSLQKLESIYGKVAESKVSTIQKNTDQNIAEAVTLNNAVYDYSKQIDQIGESIKQFSHVVSPGGAQKLTAESMGVMLNVMNQNLRTQATGLKLQAQALAIQNQKDKEQVRHMIDTSDRLKVAMKSQDTQFKMPRF